MGNFLNTTEKDTYPSVMGVPLNYTVHQDVIEIEWVGPQGALGTFVLPKRGEWKRVKAVLDTHQHVSFNADNESLPDYFGKYPVKITLAYTYTIPSSARNEIVRPLTNNLILGGYLEQFYKNVVRTVTVHESVTKVYTLM